MSEAFDLGPAEQHVANELRNAIETAISNAGKLVEALEDLDLDLIESSLLDSRHRETLIQLVQPMQNIVSNLANASLLPIMLKVVLKSAAQ